MPFEPGHNLSKGRPKGSTNKATDRIKEALHGFLVESATKEKLRETFDALEPKERARFISSLFKYAVPIQSETTMKHKVDPETRDSRINEILGKSE